MAKANVTARAATTINAPRAAVCGAFVEGHTMSKFWFTRRDEALQEGKTSTWYVGNGDDAPSFDVRVVEVNQPAQLVIEWDHEASSSRVKFTFADLEARATVLKIEESGFTGTEAEAFAQALDSTGGFNQVAIAVKALLEHGISINVVAAHA